MAGEVILVVDDHPLFRGALRVATLRAAPTASVVEAGSIAEAVDTVRTEPRVDLILLDLQMPDAVGFSGVATVHAERPDIPIVVVSAADPREAAGARRYGAAAFLSKAATLAEIEATVRDALAGVRIPLDVVDDEAVQVARRSADFFGGYAAYALDPDNADRLWDVSGKFVGDARN